MRRYIAFVHKDSDSDYGVSFPDFPGAVTGARTLDEALDMAEEALALHVEGMLTEGETVPNPSSLDHLAAHNDGGMPVLVPLRTDALAMRVQVTLPATVLRRIDEHAEEHGLSRSGFLAEAARHMLAGAGRKSTATPVGPGARMRHKPAKKDKRRRAPEGRPRRRSDSLLDL
jgi:predicted RNase H-like HicB family nuclease